ncbi:Hypothetical predicted protein [Cloeon dipterum]|uniref:Delta-like protein n=1 Tax=Cloeon dipterum TaxID=197152 RepID=A0A8S1D2U8_9INSE|nr:Hypothetical predicted protein [Cloeon dipterum]
MQMMGKHHFANCYQTLCFYLLLLLLMISEHKGVLSSGYFELQVMSMVNLRGELKNGDCCGGGARDRNTDVCPNQCITYFNVCLKEYQSNVTSTGACSFGSVDSPTLGGNSFSFNGHSRSQDRLVLPFTFRWTKSFTLILQAFDKHENASRIAEDRLIEKSTYSGIIEPSTGWHTLTHKGQKATFVYRIRVQCDENYYNVTCTTFCRPRDDKFGHFNCTPAGEKICIEGWDGPNCDVPVCKKGCLHGTCVRPGECICREGWGGDLCNECNPYPGCKQGYCKKPWDCICNVNWGGILCDQDLNYCGTHEPCLNGGTCKNTAPDNYQCACLEGFSGTNCEIVKNPCAVAPCKNKGVCQEANGHFNCTCAAGWTGHTCETNIDECDSSPCKNGGTCVDLVNNYRCICPFGWKGATCEEDVDECKADKSPCINAKSCTNLPGSYTCQCVEGWTGRNCDHNINDCVGQCQNGALCIDLVNNFYCACTSGFTGKKCEVNINECESNPCKNGGECVDGIASFRCICSVGYEGKTCEIDHDHCNPNPCKNDAECLVNPQEEDYFCHCQPNWTGKNCSTPVDFLDSCSAQSVLSNGSAISICGQHGTCVAQPGGNYWCQCEPGYTGQFCHENINDCAETVCQNGGTCVDRVNSFQCICRDGWEGTYCQDDRNECDSNPCENDGICQNGDADFVCKCRGVWKGKTCSLRNSHCDQNTCLNGGTCQDMGNTFMCRCAPGFEGSICHIPKSQACQSNPCKNGATCVNVDGGGFKCICKEGFEGNTCEKDTDDCSPMPCHNGGQCVDGVNWYRCECAKGFTGPDCRINIDDCASSPCKNGGTCIDGIGTFECTCPPGMHGQFCEQGDSYDLDCVLDGQYIKPNVSWVDNCNTCMCVSGRIRCTNVWCGPYNCREPSQRCPLTTKCVESHRENCLTPDCHPWGECLSLTSPQPFSKSYPAPADCWPNQAVISSHCARVSLTLDRSKLKSGTSVQSICNELRKIAVTYQTFSGGSDNLYILCELKSGFNNIVEATMVS